MTEILEIWADTGETMQRERTSDEQTQYETDQATAQAAAAEAATIAEQNAQATVAAIAHAKSLGFTDEMIAVMYPNLGGQ
jgi:UDP-N-acetylmuramyl pentapeptide synthase